MSDKIDGAIDRATNTIEMLSVPVQISSTGRPFKIDVPADLTDAEMLEITLWMLGPLLATVRQNREPAKGHILTPRGVKVVQ